MNPFYPLALLLSLSLMPGCSGESVKRLTYESLQSRQQIECQKDPAMACPEREPYDRYQQKRDEAAGGE